MKYHQITVKFANPIADLHTSLIDGGARNIVMHPTKDGWWSVHYEIKIDDPLVIVEQLIKESGAQPLGFKTNSHGADFDFRIDDNLDENIIRQQIIAHVKSAGYGVN